MNYAGREGQAIARITPPERASCAPGVRNIYSPAYPVWILWRRLRPRLHDRLPCFNARQRGTWHQRYIIGMILKSACCAPCASGSLNQRLRCSVKGSRRSSRACVASTCANAGARRELAGVEREIRDYSGDQGPACPAHDKTMIALRREATLTAALVPRRCRLCIHGWRRCTGKATTLAAGLEHHEQRDAARLAPAASSRR